MRLAALLIEYLLANKRLDLPGIGTFSMENAEMEEKENTKYVRQESIPGILFENDPSIKEVPDLISFISSRSGKMKALIAADLDSHLTQAKQFLNIGKPFLFEGIGSLSKLNSGGYEFVSDKLKDSSSKEIANTSSTEDSFTDYENFFSGRNTKAFWKKPVMFLLLLSGVAVAVWLGYIAFRNTISDKPLSSKEKKSETIPVSNNLLLEKDSIKSVPVSHPQTGKYKYVIEIANKYRAMERFGRLKNYGWDIMMETADSVEYKLFLLLSKVFLKSTLLW